MPETSKEELKTQPERKEATPKELASSWLLLRRDQVRREVAQVDNSIEFNRTYNKPAPQSTPRGEPGGMDYYDWEVETLAGEQEEYGREEAIDSLECERYKLLDELEGIYALKKKVEEGDPDWTEELANREKERRAAIEEKRQREEGESEK